MDFVKLILAVLQIGTALISYAERRSWIRLGELEALQRQQKATQDVLDRIAEAERVSRTRDDDARRERLREYMDTQRHSDSVAR